MFRKTGGEEARASLELLYNISRVLNTPLDLPTVLRRVIFLSMKSAGAANGSMIVLDDHGHPVDSVIITGELVHEDTTQQLRATLETGLAGWVVRNKEAVLVPDTSLDARWLRRPDDGSDRSGPKSAASTPIFVHEKLVGVMTLVHPKPGFLNEDHLSLLQIIADQAGIAVYNARLFAESRRRARVMAALAESTMAITASLNVEEVFQRILEQTRQALQVEGAALALIDPNRDELVFYAAGDRMNLNGVRLALGRGIAGWVVREGRGVVVPDIRKDRRCDPKVDCLLELETCAIACAPIRSQGEVVGVLEAINPPRMEFSPDALLVLTGIGNLAGTSIQNAQLFERLEAAHKRYQELFEDSIDPIIITDWEGNILEANRQAEIITKIERQTLRSVNIKQLQIADTRMFGSNFDRLSSGETLSYEAVLCIEDECEIPVQVYIRRLEIGGFAHLQWILRDISVQKSLDNFREDLLSMVYHDLRSPLSNVVTSLELLQNMGPKDDPAYKSLIEIAERSTLRVQRLTNALLEIHRLEASQPVGQFQPASIKTLLAEAVEAVNLLARDRDQQIELSMAPELPEVIVDPDMIQRVLINLLENAVKYSPHRSKIILSARRDQDWVQIGVKDPGPGIPPAYQESIFEKFTRFPTKDGPPGLGLGLAYCRLAVEEHGGRIWVESRPAAGAHFKFVLPVPESSGEGPEASS